MPVTWTALPHLFLNFTMTLEHSPSFSSPLVGYSWRRLHTSVEQPTLNKYKTNKETSLNSNLSLSSSRRVFSANILTEIALIFFKEHFKKKRTKISKLKRSGNPVLSVSAKNSSVGAEGDIRIQTMVQQEPRETNKCRHGSKAFSELKWEELAWVRHSSTWEEYLDKFKCQEAKCRENPGKVRARTYGTKSPGRSEALRFIDSAKSPSTWGYLDGDLAELIKRSASDRLGDLVP